MVGVIKVGSGSCSQEGRRRGGFWVVLSRRVRVRVRILEVDQSASTSLRVQILFMAVVSGRAVTGTRGSGSVSYRIFTTNKTFGLSDAESATLIRKLFFASKAGRVNGINRAKVQVDDDQGGSFVVNSKVVPGIVFRWKNAEFSELEGRVKLMVTELRQESIISGAARIRNGDDILFDKVDLKLLL